MEDPLTSTTITTTKLPLLLSANITNGKSNVYTYTQYELDLHHFINYYVYDLMGAIVFTLGIIFNVISFTYFQLSHSFRGTSMRYYFSVISITDSLRLMEWPIIVLVDKKILFLTANLCKILIFVTNLSGLISIWLLVFLSIERYIILECPFHGKNFYKIKNSIRLLIFVLMLLTLMNVPYLLPGIVRDSYSNYAVHLYMCNINLKYHIYMFINTVVIYSFVPFVILLIFNCLIISVLTRQKKLTLIFDHNDNSLNLKRERQLKEKTVLLILVSCFLIVTLSPRYIVQMLMFFFQYKNLKLFAVTKCLIVLEMFNFSFNFFFYILCSRTSRHELYLIFYYFFYYKWFNNSDFYKKNNTNSSNNNTTPSPLSNRKKKLSTISSPTTTCCSGVRSLMRNKNNTDPQLTTMYQVCKSPDEVVILHHNGNFKEANGNTNANTNNDSLDYLPRRFEPQNVLLKFNYRKHFKYGRYNSVITAPILRNDSMKADCSSIKSMKDNYGNAGKYYNMSEKSLETFLLRHSSLKSPNGALRQLPRAFYRKKTFS